MKRLFFLICFISFSAFSQSNCSEKNCMIVVDSGSTGSRAYLYEYQFSSNNTPLFIKEISATRLSPGLSSLADDKTQIDSYLSQLFSPLKQDNVILPVYYYATAGMRLLSDDQQTATYHLIEKWFNNNDNAFILKAAKTISGHEEGVYGWLAVNYLAGTFREDQAATQSVGMMDVGGASTQIAMPINQNVKVNEKNVTSLMVSGKKFRIFSKSFLGLGINEVSHQFLHEKSCFSNNYPLPNDLRGKGDVEECQKNIEILTSQVHKIDHYGINQLVQSVDKWFALGALEGLSASVPYQSLTPAFSLSDVIRLANPNACQREWKTLKNSDPENQYLYKTCLEAAYYYALIVKGYGLSETTLIQTKVDSGQALLEWTYGVVIQQHSQGK